MERHRLILLALAAILCLGGTPTQDKATEGNDLYKQGRFAEALQKYEEARKMSPKETWVDFNIGDAYYRGKKYDKAAEAFKSAAASKDMGLTADAMYNMGNSKYREGQPAVPPAGAKGVQGQAAPASPPSPADAKNVDKMVKWDEALNAYKAAIELLLKNEGSLDAQGKQLLADARANYEFVKQKQDQENQDQNQSQSQQQSQQQKQKPNDKQDKNQSQGGGGDKDNQQGQQPPPQDQKPQDKDKDKDQNKDQDQQQPQPKDQGQDQQQQPQPKDGNGDKNQQPSKAQPDQGQDQPSPQSPAEPEMSKEDAEKLLDAIRQGQEEHRNQGREKGAGRRDPTVDKDW